MEENEQLQIPKLKTAFKVLPIDLLDDPAKPMRTDLSPESVADLVSSIKQMGLIEPLVVKPVKDRFEIIAGHRRLVAAGIVEMTEIPCYIVEADEQISEMLKVHENLFRSEISPADEAKFYDWLIQHYKLSPAKIAGMINKSYGYVMDRLQVLQYPEQLRDALTKGQIKFSVAREFFRVDDRDIMLRFLYYATSSGITPALAKRWVDEWKREKEGSNNALPESPAPGAPGQQEYVVLCSCIFCRQQGRMFEMQVVYIHEDCLKNVATEEVPSAQN
jgi:ParB family chromosome partitioning protein